jgi:hypothetical protein
VILIHRVPFDSLTKSCTTQGVDDWSENELDALRIIICKYIQENCEVVLKNSSMLNFEDQNSRRTSYKIGERDFENISISITTNW